MRLYLHEETSICIQCFEYAALPIFNGLCVACGSTVLHRAPLGSEYHTLFPNRRKAKDI